MNALRGGTATARVLSTALLTTRLNTIFTDYAASPTDNDLLTNLDRSLTNVQSGIGSWPRDMQTLAQNTLIEMANNDTLLASQDVPTALKLLIAQMTGVATVKQSAVAAGAQTNAVSVTPVGNAKIISSVTRGDGLLAEYIIPETVTFTVTADAKGAGTATAGNEPVSVTAQNALPDVWAYNWPYGSGASASMNIADAQSNNTKGNLLTNSGFETFTNTDYADNWIIGTGAATTNTVKDATNFYTGSASWQLLSGAGATLTGVYQKFNTATSTGSGTGGTPAKVAAQTPYAVGFWCRVSAVPTAGVLTVALTSDTGGTVINDSNGTANSFTVALTGESTSWAFHSGVFRLPLNVGTVYLQFKITTALDNGKTMNIDNVCMTQMTNLYVGGPFFAIQRASTDVAKGDAWTVALTNTWGVFQQYFHRAFNIGGLGLVLPSNASPTVLDSLVA